MSTAPIVRRLRALRRHRQALAMKRAALTDETMVAIGDAEVAGMTVPEIARELGVSHQALYKMLGRRNGDG